MGNIAEMDFVTMNIPIGHRRCISKLIQGPASAPNPVEALAVPSVGPPGLVDRKRLRGDTSNEEGPLQKKRHIGIQQFRNSIDDLQTLDLTDQAIRKMIDDGVPNFRLPASIRKDELAGIGIARSLFSFDEGDENWTTLVGALDLPTLIYQPDFPSFSTEQACIGFWDSFIGTPLKLLVGAGADRNTSRGTSTTKRPDFILIHQGIIIFRGEEKVQRGDSATQLSNTINWTAIPLNLPFLLGYTARGTNITFWVFRRNSQPVEVFGVDLFDIEQRVRCYLAILQIARILRAMKSSLDLHPPNTPEYEPFLQRPNGVLIRFSQSSVTKEISDSITHQRISAIYHRIVGIPRVAEVQKIEETDGVLRIRLERGQKLDPSKLTRRAQFNAIQCILQAVSELHARDIVHRDIRWENILKNEKGNTFFLIDFDEACTDGLLEPSRTLASTNHAPEVTTKPHQGKPADVWSIGKLCENFLHPNWIEFQKSLLQDDPQLRPSAADALRLLETLESKLVVE